MSHSIVNGRSEFFRMRNIFYVTLMCATIYLYYYTVIGKTVAQILGLNKFKSPCLIHPSTDFTIFKG